jgi:thiol-disulfide isomerase/thioredoxin
VLPYTNGTLPPDWQTRLVPPIEGLAAAFPEGTGAFVYFSRLIGAVEAQAPAAMPALVERIAASPNSRVRELAMKRRTVLTALAQPLDLVFTALDGRSIDTKQWRGRVVLVDFWATWCVPCLKEMPNVRAAYQKYHDKGFEVIGIAFEKAPSPRAVPMERTAEQLVQFARENAMPRPHHYDGKYWENEFGRLVTTDTHGDKLDVAVRRLLAAP